MQLIHCRHFPVDHYVLVCASGEIGPLLTEARRRAESLARASTGDPRNYCLMFSGERLARRAVPHVHIICARSRFLKGLAYLYIGLKNLFAIDATVTLPERKTPPPQHGEGVKLDDR